MKETIRKRGVPISNKKKTENAPLIPVFEIFEALVLDVKSHVDSHGFLPDQGTGNHGAEKFSSLEDVAF